MLINPIFTNQLLFTTSSPTFADLTVTTINLLTIQGTATGNVALGDTNTLANVTGDYNTMVGSNTGNAITDGSYNFGLGRSALGRAISPESSFGLGYNALQGRLGGSNTFVSCIGIGPSAGRNVDTAQYVTAIGEDACLGTVAGITSDKAIGIGYRALYKITSAGSVTAIGNYAGYNLTTGGNNVFLGDYAGYNQTTLTNLLVIDNQDRGSAASEITDALMYGVFNATAANQTLRLNATVTAKDLYLTDFSAGNESIDEILDETINRGILAAITVADGGGLNITWSAGEIWDSTNLVVVETTAEATPQAVTNNSPNYLKWVSGTTLTLNTTFPTAAEIGIARICAQDGDIVGIIQAPILSVRESNIALALGSAIPIVVVSGMSVEEDTTNGTALDVKMNAGIFYAAMQVRYTPAEILSRTVNLIRHFHTGGAWDSDTNAEIDTANYDNGTAKTDLATGKWLKSVFYYSMGLINWIYPDAFYATQAQALQAPLPTIPPGMVNCVPLTALVYKTDDAALPTAGGEQWIDVRPMFGAAVLGTVTDHGGLVGLGDDDHTQYILHSLADAANDFLVASGADTFVKKTLAETGAILEGDIDHGNLQGLSTGADHSYIDQDVTSGTAPTFTADNFSDGGSNAIITTTQETNFEAAYTHVSNNGSDHSFIDQSVVSGASPTFDGTNFTGIPSAGVTNNVSATANITDHAIVRGHGGAKVVQTSSIIIDDSDNVSGMGTLACGAITSTGTTTLGDATHGLDMSSATLNWDTAAFIKLSAKVVEGFTSGFNRVGGNEFFMLAGDTDIRTVFGSGVDADTTRRFTIQSDGKMAWGPGNGTRDTLLYRSAANTLYTPDAFTSNSNIVAAGNITSNGNFFMGNRIIIDGDNAAAVDVRKNGAAGDVFAVDTINSTVVCFGDCGVGGVTSPSAQLHVDQLSASGAKPVLKLDQADIDDTFIDFVGTSAGDGTRSISSDTGELGACFGKVRVEINGVTKWVRVYDDST